MIPSLPVYQFRRAAACSALICTVLTSAGTAYAQTAIGTLTTIAGTGVSGYSGDGGPGTAARIGPFAFDSVYYSILRHGLTADAAGNVYFPDHASHRVRKISAATGIITTVAGNGTAGNAGDGGGALQAQLDQPGSVAVSASGDIYIVDADRIRKVNAATGVISTVAGGGSSGGDGLPATSVQLNNIWHSGIALDSSDNIYFVEIGAVRKVTVSTGLISTVVGNQVLGPGFSGDGSAATAAQIDTPSAVAVDGAGNIYIADWGNRRIRRVSQATGVISTIAGGGTTSVLQSGAEGQPATSVNINTVGVAIDAAGNVYIADGQRVYMVAATTGRIHTIVGRGASIAGFQGEGEIATTADITAYGIAMAPSGVLLVADHWHRRVLKVSGFTPQPILSTFAGTGTSGYNGDGLATLAHLNGPSDTIFDASGNLYVTDKGNHRIRRITANGTISTVAGTGVQGFSGDGGPAVAATLRSPSALAIDGTGNVYFVDEGNHRVRRISSSGVITTVAGNGTAGFSGDGGSATAAALWAPQAIALDNAGNLYISDYNNNRVRKVAAGSGIISTFAGGGSGGEGSVATAAYLYHPEGLLVDGAGTVYISGGLGSSNYGIRKVNSGGIITTLATMNDAGAIDVNAGGDLFVADGARFVYRVSTSTGKVSTVAGNSLTGFGGDGSPATVGALYSPSGVAFDAAGNMFIADRGNSRVRKVTFPAPVVPPSNVTLQRYGPTSVILNWTAAPGATSYIVKRGTSPGAMTPYAGGIAATSAYIAGTKNTRYYFTVSAVFGSVESPNANTVAISLTTNAGRGDLDGDGASDLLLYRAASGNWFSRNSANSYAVGAGTWNLQWGAPGDVPMNGDFDADGRIDPTVFRPSTGQWFILYSSTGYNPAQYGYLEWGAGGDVPFAADFDGDGYCDIGIFRPASGYWYLRLSSQGWTPGAGASTFAWGAAGDVPITGDLDGDGKADIGVFRPTTGQWFFLYSSINYNAAQYGYFEWGASGDINLTADFDGDARGDIGVYRPSTGQWFLRLSSLGYSAAQYGYFAWGAGGDEPKMGDFDGDGRGDVTVYRPTSGSWFILYSSRNYDPAQAGAFGWGATGDIAMPTN